MKYILTLLLLFTCIGISSQTQISKKDKEIFTIFLDELNNGSVKKGLKLADSTYLKAIKDNNKILEILMLKILATGNNKEGSLKNSNNFYLKQHNKIIKLNNSYLKDSLLIENLNIHGNNYLNSGDFPKGVDNFLKALTIGKKNKDSILIGKTYQLLGNAYGRQGFHDDAISYYAECVKYNISRKIKNSIDNNLGIIYRHKKDYKRAEKHLLETLKTNDSTNLKDSSLSYYNLAYLYTRMKDYKKAHTFFLKADKDAAQLNDKPYQLNTKLNLIMSFANIKDYKSSKFYMKVCDSLASKIESNDLKMDLYRKIYGSSAKMKDYKTAFENVKKFMVAYDEKYDIETRKVLKNIKEKYQSDLKETEILAQKELIATKNKQNTWLLIGLGLLITAIVFLFFVHRKKIAVQKMLLLKQNELANEKIKTVLEKQKVKTYQSYTDGQNKERERIAKDLHDSVSGNLAAIKLKLTNLKNAQSKEIDAVISNLDTTYNEVRTISHNLLPQKIITQNFTKNIEQLVSLYRSDNLKIGVEIFPEEEINKLPQKIEIELSRILQELITNITKHAQASKCNISITLHDRHLNLIVEDNGIGFNTENKSKGIGLSNILSRIQSMNGSLDIDSSIGKGTTVNINVLTN